MRTRTALLLSGCLLALPALAQTSTTISNLPSASTPLSGSEVFPVVQSGATKKVSASNLLPLSGVTAGTYGDSTHCASFTVAANGTLTGASQDTSCPGSSGVTSVFGRTGDVVATSGDYSFSQLSSIPTTVSGYGITDAVTLTGTQTLTNKTLTAPVISTITNTGTLTLPTSTDTLVGRNTTDTLTNKTLTSPTMTAPVLGTIASGNGAALTSLNPANLSTFVSTAKGGLGADNSAATGVPVFSAGVNTMTATTGSGSVVRATSPTLVTPALGTPASGNASNLTNIPVAQATGVLPAANGGAGTISGILKANGSGTVSAATSGTDYLSPSLALNTQTGTTYATQASDAAKVVTLSNASPVAVSIVQANTTNFTAGFGTTYANFGAGLVTITAATSTFGNGLTTLKLSTGQVADIGSDGTNYPFTALSLPKMADNTVLGNNSGSANYPTALSAAQMVTLMSAAVTNAGQTFTGQQTNAVTTLTISTATFTPDGTNNNYKIALTSACPCTIANPSATPVAGTSGVIEIDQDATGSRTVGTWGSQYIAAGGVSTLTLSTAASAKDIFSYYVLDSTHILVTSGALNATH